MDTFYAEEPGYGGEAELDSGRHSELDTGRHSELDSERDTERDLPLTDYEPGYGGGGAAPEPNSYGRAPAPNSYGRAPTPASRAPTPTEAGPERRAPPSGSVSLGEIDRVLPTDNTQDVQKTSSARGVKVLLALFVSYLAVVNDVFTNNVLSGFKGAVSGRNPTTYGVCVAGIFLVLFYILATYLIDNRIV